VSVHFIVWIVLRNHFSSLSRGVVVLNLPFFERPPSLLSISNFFLILRVSSLPRGGGKLEMVKNPFRNLS